MNALRATASPTGFATGLRPAGPAGPAGLLPAGLAELRSAAAAELLPAGPAGLGRTDRAGRGRPADPAQAAKLRKAAQDFESVFLGLMLSNMRQTVHADERFSGGVGERAFRPLLDEQFAQAASRRGGGFGIGEILYRSLERNLPRASAPAVDLKA